MLEYDDDAPVGRVLTRREVLAFFGAASAALLAACVPATSSSGQPAAAPPGGAVPGAAATAPAASGGAASTPLASGATAAPACIVRPAQTEGPYFIDEKLNRSDIRTEPSDGSVRDGMPLRLVLQVSKVAGGACAPLSGAVVDVWQCDAQGVYSDVQDGNGFFATKGKKFLRGSQVTDADGTVQFLTIYPGWYEGRTVHIHFKVRMNPAATKGSEFTSQLYFDDAITDQVHAQAPYSAKGKRTMRNSGDGIYRDGGSQLLVALAKDGTGYVGTFGVGVQSA
ncbi:MAG: intradiol ring-cleavage dioxygenase [Chloroflexi bacterium]|nr:intradiol ring-cleavage dioxygenase [Chloroflexota bacterium]